MGWPSPPKRDVSGQKFGRLTALQRVGTTPRYQTLWKCRCDCGSEIQATLGHLTSGHTKSCGCLRSDKTTITGRKNTKPPGYPGLTYLIGQYRASARKRRLVFDLTRDQVADLTTRNCSYCGIEPSQDNLRHPYRHNGIDRVDNSMGYSIENCVPCCKNCNYAKRNMEHDNFISWVARLANHYKGETK